MTNPLQAHLKTLGGLRDGYPELSTGASVVRLQQGGVLVVSRIDATSGREIVVAFNNTSQAAKVTVATATPGTWSVVFGGGSASGNLTLTVPPVSGIVAMITLPGAASFSSLPSVPTARSSTRKSIRWACPSDM